MNHCKILNGYVRKKFRIINAIYALVQKTVPHIVLICGTVKGEVYDEKDMSYWSCSCLIKVMASSTDKIFPNDTSLSSMTRAGKTIAP